MKNPKNPNNISLNLFSFSDFLDSLGVVNIKQPFGKRIEAEKLYLTFLVELINNNHDLSKVIRKLIVFQILIMLNPNLRIMKIIQMTRIIKLLA